MCDVIDIFVDMCRYLVLPHLVLPDEVAEGRLRVEGEGGGDLGRYRAEQYHLSRGSLPSSSFGDQKPIPFT